MIWRGTTVWWSNAPGGLTGWDAGGGQHPTHIYLPYLAGTADERQFRVMADREKRFRAVMGQKALVQLIPEDNEGGVPLPGVVVDQLNFNLSLRGVAGWLGTASMGLPRLSHRTP